MMLPRERKNPTRIKFYLVGQVSQTQFPRWSWSISQGLEFSTAQSVDHDDWLTFIKHLVERKLQFPCVMLFLLLRNKSEFENIALSQMLALDHQTLPRGEH